MKNYDIFAQGNTADIYRDGDRVLKWYHSESMATVEIEARNQRYAKSLGLPLPAVIEVTGIDGRPVLVMDYLPADWLRGRRDSAMAPGCIRREGE